MERSAMTELQRLEAGSTGGSRSDRITVANIKERPPVYFSLERYSIIAVFPIFLAQSSGVCRTREPSNALVIVSAPPSGMGQVHGFVGHLLAYFLSFGVPERLGLLCIQKGSFF